MNNSIDLSFNVKENIRKITLDDIEIGSDSSLPFMTENHNTAKPLVAIEVLYKQDETYPDVIKNIWKTTDIAEILKKAQSTNADIVSIKFNIKYEDLNAEKENIKQFLQKISKTISKPLILRGANNNETDEELIPLLCENAPKKSIIAFADEQTYEKIVPPVVKNNHILVLRTPIDINIAKELNILTIDKGLSPDRILIDPDMGGLGYGLDYGYSIIEKIRLAAFDGDTMLNMPIIAFIGEETYRAKEAKSDTFNLQWGEYAQRAAMWEISGASAMICAGADIVVLWNPDSVNTLKGLL